MKITKDNIRNFHENNFSLRSNFSFTNQELLNAASNGEIHLKEIKINAGQAHLSNPHMLSEGQTLTVEGLDNFSRKITWSFQNPENSTNQETVSDPIGKDIFEKMGI